jgi:dCTP deaminase
MILTGPEIAAEVHAGRIVISPFDEDQLNPNSYNYRLGPALKVTDDTCLDPLVSSQWNEIILHESGYVLLPDHLYLGSTMEELGSSFYVLSLIGRSSIGRLGMFLELSADMGNLGPAHCWTLEIKVVQPLRVYAGMRIGQVSFWQPHGSMRLYQGGYSGFSVPTPAQLPKTGTDIVP